MDTEVLVRDHIETGRRLVEGVRLQGLSVIAAYWFKDDERGYWRLILISPDVPAKGPSWAHARFRAAVRGLKTDARTAALAEDVYDAASILGPDTRMFVDMQRSLANADRSEIRESNFRGAYVYELTAPQPVGS